ncbi:MAG: T9SS type A sorting domain-containing protein [Bacteroidetes bacterium]|nr:T9SS type A sorting domain-containing protein [Bacteroidota bacterium]
MFPSDFTYIQTGINNVDASNSISVYPNPASNQISFVIDNVNDGGIATLVDVTGRTITTQIINSGLNTMDVSSFAKRCLLPYCKEWWKF